MKKLGLGLIAATLGMCWMPIYGIFHDPSLALKHWDFFLLFVAVPVLMGTGMCLYARRRDRKA